MSKLKINIDCSNDAFEEDLEYEVARILRNAADKLRSGETEGTLRDINGNTVGSYKLTGRKKKS